MIHYHLAQLNIAEMLEPLDSPTMADFVANLDRINALADAAPGFVWRLQTEQGDATGVKDFGETIIVNMSVWESPEALHDYVYETAHVEILRRRKEWFSRMRNAYAVLWWVPAGHRPSVAEGKERLELLREHGPSERAFTFEKIFPAPDQLGSSSPETRSLDGCPT